VDAVSLERALQSLAMVALLALILFTLEMSR
jgi:hypothetical protein